jgi:hypothetical protein
MQWLIQVENFIMPAPSPGLQFKMIFGGLGDTYSGYLWEYTFIWDNTIDQTNHGVVTQSSQGAACPIIEAQPITGTTRTVLFSGEPSALYHVYRSQNASGAGNNASNGRYLYLFSITTDAGGLGEFTETDTYTGPNWYLVIQADPITNAIIGCHSEEGTPTNVRVINFEAAYQPAEHKVQLSWTTTSEVDMRGFNLYRSTEPVRPGTPINTEMIDAEKFPLPDGSDYVYPDADIAYGVTYYYWLEIVGIGDDRQDAGRAEVTVPNAVEPKEYYYYLPLFLK